MTDGLITSDVGLAVERLRAGGLVAMPTETVYGLAADAANPAALARVFAVKGRPVDHPLIVHVADAGRATRWAADLPPAAVALADACWPGPLTLLVRRAATVLDDVTGGRDTVGLRVPAHPMAHELLERFDGGLAAPSANRFGKVSPTTAQHVLDDLGPYLDPVRDAILDGGASPVGVESTIVDCTVDPPQVLRPGAISATEVAAIVGGPLAEARGPSRAAGMLASHYAPVAAVHLADDADDAAAIAGDLDEVGRRAIVIDRTDDLVAYARTLYAELRAADARGITDVVAVLPAAAGLGHAIRDRLTKAAAAR